MCALPTLGDQPGSTGQVNPAVHHHNASRARGAAKARVLQRLYRANPGACMRRILEAGPPVYCKIAETELVDHFTGTYTEPTPLGPTPEWLFSERSPADVGEGVRGKGPPSQRCPETSGGGDILGEPFSPREILDQFRRARRSAPGCDGLH